mmetsp:Transcript_34070/g.65931  ORF Transcript_34070/g.65931 Transcript_34070/m.65931 type:complete len:225 (-) Transcript_34070:324-998(-)
MRTVRTAARVIGPARAAAARVRVRTVPRASLAMTQTRCFSIFGSMSETSVEYVKEKSLTDFRKALEKIMEMKRFRLENFKQLMEESARTAGATGWRSNLPSFMKGEKEELEEVKKQLRILEQFKGRELMMRESREMKSPEKQRIAKDAGVQVSDVNLVLRQFDSQVTIHKWLKSRIERKLPIPTSPEELQGFMQVDQPKLTNSEKRQQTKLRKRMRNMNPDLMQ